MQRTRVQVPAPTWQSITICNSSSRGIQHFYPGSLGTVCPRYTCTRVHMQACNIKVNKPGGKTVSHNGLFPFINRLFRYWVLVMKSWVHSSHGTPTGSESSHWVTESCVQYGCLIFLMGDSPGTMEHQRARGVHYSHWYPVTCLSGLSGLGKKKMAWHH